MRHVAWLLMRKNALGVEKSRQTTLHRGRGAVMACYSAPGALGSLYTGIGGLRRSWGLGTTLLTHSSAEMMGDKGEEGHDHEGIH